MSGVLLVELNLFNRFNLCECPSFPRPCLNHAAPQVPTMQKFRRSMPEGTRIQICKNNLMKVAVEESEGWAELKNNGCTVSEAGSCAAECTSRSGYAAAACGAAACGSIMTLYAGAGSWRHEKWRLPQH